MRADYELILLAAGHGRRMKISRNKVLLPLLDRPVIEYSLTTFLNDPHCVHIILVAKEDEIGLLKNLLQQSHFQASQTPLTLAVGGLERQDSAFNGLKQLKNKTNGIVLLHDGARPFIEKRYVQEINEKVVETGAAVLGVPVKDTIKQVSRNGDVKQTLPRPELWMIQTPQAFRSSLILEAHKEARKDGFLGTDDASLVERIGGNVAVVRGSYENIKITTQGDLITGKAILLHQHEHTLSEEEWI